MCVSVRTNVRTYARDSAAKRRNTEDNRKRTLVAKARAPAVSTKSRIDRGAARLFVRNGYDGTSMRDLARNLGLQPSSIYGHVKSKQELLFRVMERLMDEVLTRANEALKADGRPEELVRRLVVTNICQPGPYETALLQSGLKSLQPSYRASIARKQREYRTLWLRVLEDGKKQGVFRIRGSQARLPRHRRSACPHRALVQSHRSIDAPGGSRGVRRLDPELSRLSTTGEKPQRRHC